MTKKPLDRKKPLWCNRLSFMPFYCFIRDEKMWHKALKQIEMDDMRAAAHAARSTPAEQWAQRDGLLLGRVGQGQTRPRAGSDAACIPT